MLSPQQRQGIIDLAWSMQGRPYLLGAKWDIDNPNPSGPIDCSGFARWCYRQGSGIILPDGSYNQFDQTIAIDEPLIADPAFFYAPGTKGPIDHIGLMADDKSMIEARGNPYNAVIIRPRAKWEAYALFSGYRRFKVAL